MSPDTVRDWISTHAQPIAHLDAAAPLDDLAALSDIAGDAVVFGLGETTRAGREVMLLGHRVLRFLVEREGFRALVLQDDESVLADLDRYVRTGLGELTTILRRAWIPWQNTNTVNILRWIRRFNQEHPDDMIRLFGLTPPNAQPAHYDQVLAHIEQVAADRLGEALDRYDTIRTAHELGEHIQQARGTHPGTPFVELAREVRELVASLPVVDKQVLELGDLIVDFHANSVAAGYDFEASATHAADRIIALHRRTGLRILYWEGIAHTSVSDTLRLNALDATMSTVGTRLRREFGRGYVSLAIGFDHGEIHDGELVPAPQEDFVDALLSAPESDSYLLDLRGPHPAPITEWLAGAHKIRIIAGIYNPANDADHHLSGGDLDTMFDALIRTRTITPTIMLTEPVDSAG